MKKIDVNGNMTNIYKSKGNWAPLHGVFDNDNRLWVLESSDKNDIRVTLAGTTPLKTDTSNPNFGELPYCKFLGVGSLVGLPEVDKF